MAVVLVAGGSTLLAEVAAVTLLQRATEPAALARVFGLYDQLNVGAIAAGSALAGPSVAWLGPRAAVALTGALCVVAVLPLALGLFGARSGEAATVSGRRAARRGRVPAA